MLNILKKRSSRASKASNLTIKSEQSSHLDFDVLFEMMKKLQEKTQYLLSRHKTKKMCIMLYEKSDLIKYLSRFFSRKIGLKSFFLVSIGTRLKIIFLTIMSLSGCKNDKPRNLTIIMRNKNFLK